MKLGISFARILTLAGASLFGVAAQSQPVRAADTYKVDAVHSSVLYRVKHMNASYAYGRFNDFSGSFTIDSADPTKCAFDLVVKTAAIDSGNEKRDQHLKSPDFLNAKQFPTIAFKSEKVEAKGKDSYLVTGNLTLHGTTKPVTIEVETTGTATGPRGGKVAGIEATFTIKRSDFGMKNMIPMVGDEIRLIASLEGNHQ